MQLAVDIGNTNTVFGIHNGSWVKVFRLVTTEISEDSLMELLKKEIKDDWHLSKIVVSSVVPEVTDRITSGLSSLYSIQPYLINPSSYDKLDIDVVNPTEIGSDLVSNAVAVTNMYLDSCIVVDFGTALTFTVIHQNKIIGVNILPGIKTALKALVGNASQLNHIPLKLTPSVVGTNTETAIQSGILWGYVGLVERMLERIEYEMTVPLKKVATGGLSLLLPPLQKKFDLIDQNLTLEGIRLIGLSNG